MVMVHPVVGDANFDMVYMVKIHLGVDMADVNGSIDVKGTLRCG